MLLVCFRIYLKISSEVYILNFGYPLSGAYYVRKNVTICVYFVKIREAAGETFGKHY
jgi:hypothetical protein